MSQELEFRILGPLEASREGNVVDLGARQQRALLAMLLLHANEVVSRDRLIDAIWGEAPPDRARNMIQVYVSRLRRALGPGSLVTKSPGYVLRVAEQQLDAIRLARLVARARDALAGAHANAARELLTDAIGLWRGEPLADFAYEAFAQSEVARLEELRLEALELRMDADLALGRHSRLIGELEQLIATHPFRERLRGQLMLALYRSGRQAEALKVYSVARTVLVEELGIEPGPALQGLQHAILAHDPALLSPTREQEPVAEARDARSIGNLPPELTSLIGRAEDVERVVDLISAHRLVAVVGAGGVGKTRLAQRTARDVAPRFGDGVWFVDLAAIEQTDDVAGAVLSATGVSDRPGVPALDTLADELSGRRLLLLLDNCEHVLGSAAEVAGRLLNDCPGVRILATSREPLTIPGERVERLEPLATAANGSQPPAAVELFFDRAATHGVSWQEPQQVLDTILKVCQMLDGLPLAIELAAARTRAISPADLLDHLDDRLRLLSRPSHWPANARQRTLESTIAWSYELLAPEEQATLRRLAVFHGGFSVPAAAAVCADIGSALDTLDRITALIDRSVVTIERRNVSARYRLLESIALFAARALQDHREADAARDRHARFFLGLVREATTQLDSREQAIGAALLDVEQDNLTAALSWCLDGSGNRDTGAALIAELGWHWSLRGRSNVAKRWLQRTLGQQDRIARATLGAVHVAYSALAYSTSDLDKSRTCATEAVAIAREINDPDFLAWALARLAFSYQGFGSDLHASAVATELRSLQPGLSSPRAQIEALLASAQVALYTGHRDQAIAEATSAREIARRARDHLRAANSGFWLAYALALGSDIPSARTAISEATPDAVRSGYELAVVDNLIGVTTLALTADDPETAQRTLPKVIEMLRQQQRWDDLGGCLRLAAATELKQGSPERSAVLLGAAGRWTDHVDVEDELLLPGLGDLKKRLIAHLGAHAFAQAHEHGTTLDLDRIAVLLSDPEHAT